MLFVYINFVWLHTLITQLFRGAVVFVFAKFQRDLSTWPDSVKVRASYHYTVR